MSKDNSPLNIGERVWDDDPFVRALNLSAELGKVLGDIAASGHAPDENAERVAELERQLAEARQKLAAYSGQIAELGRELAEAQAHREQAVQENDELRRANEHLSDLLGACYVVREVPWSDVAAGMMTIARDGTPWMVGVVHDDGRVILRNADQAFTKNPTRGETVRVLVPYVTPEQAESLVKGELGGTAVS